MRLTLSMCLLLLIAGCALTPVDSVVAVPNNNFAAYVDYVPTCMLDVGVATSYVSPNKPMHVIKDDVVLDWGAPHSRQDGGFQGGYSERPDTYTSQCFDLDGRKRVVLRNFWLHGFKVGVYAKNCEGLTIENFMFSDMFRQRLHSTPDREDERDWLWPHNNDNHEWMNNYGACIVLENCKNCVIRNCSAKGTQNGIILDKCEGCQVYNNDFSYCSGWGCALWRSSKNTVAQNRFDYCVRGYSDGVYARGQDSAGILVFEQCCDNVFAYNSATHSGDGFFLYAGHETTQRTGKGGCNRNLVYGNDFSYAVANGIEATFSDGNVFAKNSLRGCDYGLWGGYSYNTLIASNYVYDCLTAGIAIEHGHDNRLEGNDFMGETSKLWLWWDEDREFAAGPYGRNNNVRSEKNTVIRNSFSKMEDAILLDQTSATLIESCIFSKCANSLALRGPCGETRFARNVLLNSGLARREGESSEIHELDSNYEEPTPTGLDKKHFRRVGEAPKKAYSIDCDTPVVRAPATLGKADASKRIWAAKSVGRAWIFISQWGPEEVPFDGMPRELITASSGNGHHWIVCTESLYTPYVSKVEGDVKAHLPEGDKKCYPLTITGQHAGLIEYRVYVDFLEPGGAILGHVPPKPEPIVIVGSLQSLDWKVRFWQWTPTEGSDLPPDWDKLVASPPLKTVTEHSLNYNNRGAAPEWDVPADHYATVATTEIELPAGSWKLVLTSDDGGRLFVDGEKVIEHWDIHGPSDDEYMLKLEKPRKVALRVEHFENTGWAALALRIERTD